MSGGKGKSGGKTGGPPKFTANGRRAPVSWSTKAGLQFPVTRMQKRARDGVHKLRMSRNGAGFMTAVIEYLVSEILELAGNAATDLKAKRISPRHILLAVRGDEELDQLIQATISGGGVLPHINKALLKNAGNKST